MINATKIYNIACKYIIRRPTFHNMYKRYRYLLSENVSIYETIILRYVVSYIAFENSRDLRLKKTLTPLPRIKID